MMQSLNDLLTLTASRHNHLCPRQVLGVRMGLAGAGALGMELPRRDKELLTIIETDGCFADGIEVTTGCTVGHRTLRLEDFGKAAATFIQVSNGRAIRLAPRPGVRQRARLYAPEQTRRYFSQLYGYQRMPTEELFTFQEVMLAMPLRDLISRPGVRVNCAECGEEIINQREVLTGETILCRGCAGMAYYACVEIQGVPGIAMLRETILDTVES